MKDWEISKLLIVEKIWKNQVGNLLKMLGDMDNFKARLKFYMSRAGLNPTSLSRKARLNVTAVRDILEHTGTPNPRIDTFIKLCHALGIGPHQLSQDFANLYPPRQLELLEDIDEMNERNTQLSTEVTKEKNKRKTVRKDELPDA
jgi:hypothetical protein